MRLLGGHRFTYSIVSSTSRSPGLCGCRAGRESPGCLRTSEPPARRQLVIERLDHEHADYADERRDDQAGSSAPGRFA
jgi:hypothetical protein